MAPPRTSAWRAHAPDADAGGIGGARVFADGAEIEAPGVRKRRNARDGHGEERDISEGGLIEEAPGRGTGCRARPRDRYGCHGDDVRRHRRLAEDQPVEIEGEAAGEQRHADAGNVLADAEHDGEQRHDQPGERAGRQRREDADEEVAAEIGRREADHGAEQHDPLDAEIEDAGALIDRLAERGKEQRRRDADHRREEADVEEGGEYVKHGGRRAAGRP